MKNLGLLLGLIIMNTLSMAQVKVYSDKELSTISYYMHHPMHEWTGVSKEATSIILTDDKKEVITKVVVSVKIASFDSKNANRDSHVIEATEGLLYPTITFSSDTIIQNGEKLSVSGALTFHGVLQKVSFNAVVKKSKNRIEITGGFPLKMTAFKIEPPSLMGIATTDEFKISFDMFY
jgi:polyisoprenoid-binding protein YceI